MYMMRGRREVVSTDGLGTAGEECDWECGWDCDGDKRTGATESSRASTVMYVT